jgi:hypothetical protein
VGQGNEEEEGTVEIHILQLNSEARPFQSHDDGGDARRRPCFSSVEGESDGAGGRAV